MKKIVMIILCLGMAISISMQAQTDTVRVPSDLGAGGNLNTAISNVIAADTSGAQFSNTVFLLEPDGYYILTSTITTPANSHFYLEGPAPGMTPATAPPMIVWTTSGGVTTTYNFDCYGDVTMKNVWILCANVQGSQIGSSLVIEDNSLANLSGKGEHADFDGCIFDYQNIGNGGGEIEPACQHFRCHITNTWFRNFTDPHYKYYGRPVSWTYQSTTWHTDSLIFENCTISNCGYAYMQEAPEYADYVSFNHCTIANTMMHTFESSYWWNLAVTNCIFVNAWMTGDEPSQDGKQKIPNGGTINIDSVVTFSFPVTFTDSSTAPAARQRHILFANCSYGFEQWYIDFLNNNSYNASAPDSNKMYRMPMLSGKTMRFFVDSVNGAKKFPYMNMANLYPAVDTLPQVAAVYDASSDPGFIANPTEIDSIEGFLIGRWSTGVNISWAYHPEQDYGQVWPINDDLSYSNSTLKSAAMSNLPLGDLFHWWGSTYTTWLAQSATEHNNITTWLTTGQQVVGSVKQNKTNIPGTFELGQNYPNPFNPTTQISYSIPVKGYVSLKVYNILGEEVATLISGVQPSGDHVITFNAIKYASGVYFYRLQSGNFSDTKKLILIK